MLKADSKSVVVKKRKVSARGCKAKGNKGESEFCTIMTKLGIPTQKVVASGSFKRTGAEADVKVGVVLNPDGSFPPADETQGILRAECKNMASTPDRYWTDLKDEDLTVVMSTRPAQEEAWKQLRQSKSNRVLALRRPKVPAGAIKNEQWGEVQGVFMDVEVFAMLMRRAYPERVFYIPEVFELNPELLKEAA